MADDARLERLTELLEEALELVTQADAEQQLRRVARLCREAGAVAEGDG